MYDNNNIFAKILKKEIPCKAAFEDEHTLIFHDVNPAAPVHLLAIPKGKYISFQDFTAKATSAEITSFFAAIAKITKQLKIDDSGYRLITNHGKNGMQTAPHFHMHILAGKKLGALIQDEQYHGSL